MKVITTALGMAQLATETKARSNSLGFVPTMGALHRGHAALVERALTENDVVVASIFVNPTQFNDPRDLERYPRTFEADARLLESIGCHAVFYPSVREMYPNGTNHNPLALGRLAEVMEGAFRPGHFNGVVQVVSRLFDLVQPHRAYFGEKDFQQLAVIRHMTMAQARPIEIIGCPTVREADGLAMSSRNTLLSTEARDHALALYRTLCTLHDCAATKMWETMAAEGFNALVASPGVQPEYLTVVDGHTLEPLSNGQNPTLVVACVAAKVGGVRLIDNLRLFP